MKITSTQSETIFFKKAPLFSIFVSYDETLSWSEGKVICHGSSMYSSMTVLQDGTIGIYFEKGTDGRELWYENVSLDWVTAPKPSIAVPEGVRLWEGGPLWAEFNVGASSPAGTGGYFAWGEVPSKQEWEELVSRCDWTWTTLDGANGYRVRGDNGNEIFIPATGYYSGDYLKECGYFGYYWTADADPELPYFAWDFYFQQVHC